MANKRQLSPSSHQFSNGFVEFMTGGNIPSSLESQSSQPSPEVEYYHLKRKKEKYLDQIEICNGFWGKDVNKYIPLAKIGQGSYGEVYKAQDKRNNQHIVAMKKIINHRLTEGFPINVLREIRILKQLNHENIINLLEVCHTKACRTSTYRSAFFLIFEFCEHDLAGLLSNANVKFNLAEIKELLRQLFNGLFYVHANKILHRDLKSSNILVTKRGVLKLADFGLSRAFSTPTEYKPNNYTNCVVTLWYRAPELLLGERNYGPAIDMWGAGCIMAEFWTRFPIMRGSTEADQLKFISMMCGSITPELWPNVINYELYRNMKLPTNDNRRDIWRCLQQQYVQNAEACDLIDKLLTLDPEKRFNADTALNHAFFWTDPMPCNLLQAMSKIQSSNYEYSFIQPHVSNHQSIIKQAAPPAANNSVASTTSFPDRIF